MKDQEIKKTELTIWTESAIDTICKFTKRSDLVKFWSEARRELSNIKSGIAGTKNTITIATQRKAVANVRKAIKQLPETQRSKKLKYWALEQTNSDKGIKNGIVTIEHSKAKEHSIKKLESWNKQRTESKQLTRTQFQEIEKICEKWLESYDLSQRTLALMFFTGRRETEIVKTAHFKAIRKEKTAAIFTGQLKKKIGGESYKIEIENRTKVIKSLKEFRELFPHFLDMDNELINRHINRKLAEQGYKLFRKIGWNQFERNINRGYSQGNKRIEVIPDVHPHDLRKIYIAYHVEKNMKNATEGQKQAYAQELLGHDKNDIRASSHYGNWRIVE